MITISTLNAIESLVDRCYLTEEDAQLAAATINRTLSADDNGSYVHFTRGRGWRIRWLSSPADQLSDHLGF